MVEELTSKVDEFLSQLPEAEQEKRLKKLRAYTASLRRSGRATARKASRAVRSPRTTP
jgi:hypothetical protein